MANVATSSPWSSFVEMTNYIYIYTVYKTYGYIWIIHVMKKRWPWPLDFDLEPEIRNLKSHSVRRVASRKRLRKRLCDAGGWLKGFLSQAEHIPWLFFHDLLMISLLQSTSMWWTCCSSLLRHRWTVGPQGMPLVISWNVSGSQIETFETRLQTRDFRAHFDPFCAFRILEAGPIYDYHHGWGWWTWLWSCGLCGSTSEGQIPDDKSCWSLALSIPTIPLSRDFSHVSVRSPLNCCFNSIQFWFLSRYQIMYYYWFYTCYPHTIPYYVSLFWCFCLHVQPMLSALSVISTLDSRVARSNTSSTFRDADKQVLPTEEESPGTITPRTRFTVETQDTSK